MADEERKVAFVTGGSSGIGRATVKAFASKGYAVAIADRDEAGGKAVEAEIRQAGGEALFLTCDTSDDASVKQAVEGAVAAFGRLDAAFNAAGIDGEQGRATADCSRENWDRVLAIDLTGVWLCMRHQIPAMLASGGGSIVNCSSSAGIAGAPNFAAYCAAKHGVVGLTKAAALEYVRQGIRVNAVAPGMIETPMTAGLPDELVEQLCNVMPAGRMGKPEEIASAVLWLTDPSASFVTGQVVPVDGGYTSQ